MALKSLFIIFIFIQLYLSNTSEIVSISFNSFYKKGTNNIISSIDDLAHSNLHSKISIGEPSYEIIAFLSVQHSYFSITPNHFSKNVNDFLSHYDILKSNSFKNITTNGRNLIDTNYDSVAKEKFEINMFNYLKNERYNRTIDDMIFIYNDDIKNKNNKESNYYLNIGFQIINKKKYKERENFNFIHQLKKRDIIKNYDWCIFFEKGKNENGIFLYNPDELIYAKGELLIGDLPSNYNSNYHISQLLTTYSIYNDNFFKWALEFSNIFYNKTVNESININYVDVQININNYIILAPIVYFHNIKKDFFDYYISNNICKLYQGIEYTTFFCEKSDKFNEEHLKKFPTLYMDHKEFQYTFEFTYEDLFVEKDGKYWFLIALSSFNKDLGDWHMGIILLRKYNLIFNQDSKTISFYNTNLPIIDSQNPEKKYSGINNIRYIAILLVIFLVTCIIVVFIIKSYKRNYMFKPNKEKKRLNHIYDNEDFDYIEHDNFDINKKLYNKQNLLMEMKGLIYT